MVTNTASREARVAVDLRIYIDEARPIYPVPMRGVREEFGLASAYQENHTLCFFWLTHLRREMILVAERRHDKKYEEV